jgi:cation:H+ antiporter
MFLAATYILLGVAMLYGGAEGLVRGSASIARRLGLSPLVIGLTVVAFGTSMPEMVVSVRAVLAGQSPIAAGNVVGSNIANIALILGLSALLRPLRVQARLIRIDVPVLIAATLAMTALLWDGRFGRVEGAVFTAGVIGYTAMGLGLSRREPSAVHAEFAEATPGPSGSWFRDVALVAAGLGLLVWGARLLVSGAVVVAQDLGVGEAVIGLTVVAVGTSLPELATSLVAATRGEGDIAVGNVVGSNIFNILGILGVSSLVRPLTGAGMTPVDLGVMAGLTLVMLPLMRTGFRVSRAEGGFLLAVYGAYIAWLARG